MFMVYMPAGTSGLQARKQCKHYDHCLKKKTEITIKWN